MESIHNERQTIKNCKMIRINKKLWHYKIRKFYKLFIDIHTKRSVDIDIKVTKFQYILEVLFGVFFIIVFTIVVIVLKILDFLEIAELIDNYLKKLRKRRII